MKSPSIVYYFGTKRVLSKQAVFDTMSRMEPHRTFRVLAAIDLSSSAGRQKLAGLHQFLAEGYDWDLDLARTHEECTAERIAAAARDGVEGFLMAIPESREMHRLHKSLGLPTAFIDYPDGQTLRDFKRCVFVMEDTRDICRTAVQTLLSQRACRSYCYVEARTDLRWSRERGDMFQAELSRRNIKMRRLGPEDSASRERTASWLASLEKPAAILAAYDDVARTLLNLCKGMGLETPGDVNILGIGDDEIVCMHTKPALSSIKPGFKEEGYRAARELQSMMMVRRAPARRTFLCGGAEVVERESTRRVSSAGTMVRNAIAFIEDNALRGIGASDVAAHLKVSRRLMDLRFRESTGTSVLQAILERRMGEVRRMLSETTLPISEVAVRCGYPDANYLKNLFKSRHGISMRAYRKCSYSLNKSSSVTSD